MTLDKDFERYMQRVLDSGHQSRPGANAPPAGTWQHVLATVQPQEEENNDMSATTITADASRTPGVRLRVSPAQSPNRRRFGHYLNLAATIALVAAVAIAGWFAAMQLNSLNGSDETFGLLGQSNGGASCDVEAMTVADVMSIVKNPYAGIEWQEGPSPEEVLTMRDLATRELVEDPIVEVDLGILNGEHSVPDESDFIEAAFVTDRFLACLQSGTMGQLLRFYDPRTVQGIVLSEYPVFRDEEQIQSDLTTLLNLPAADIAAPYAEALTATGLTYASNPDRNSSGAYQYSYEYAERYNASRVIVVGIRVTDATGEVVFQNDVDGRADPIGTLKTTDRLRVMLIDSTLSGDWVVAAVIPE